MRLTGDSFKQLRDALHSAFSEDELRSMLRMELDTALDDIVERGPLVTRIEDLIHWFERKSRLPDLLTAAQSDNPTNPLLTAVQLEFKSDQSVDISTEAGAHEQEEPEETEDELGLLDYLEIGDDRFGSATTIIERIGTASVDVSSVMNVGSEEYNQLNRIGAGVSERKRVLKRIAQSMNDYSDQMEDDVPDLAQTYSEGIEAYLGMMQVLPDFKVGKGEMLSLLASARNMRTNLFRLAESAEVAGEAIGKGPRIIKEVNRAKRRTERILTRLVEYLDIAIKQTEEFIRVLEVFIRGPKNVR